MAKKKVKIEKSAADIAYENAQAVAYQNAEELLQVRYEIARLNEIKDRLVPLVREAVRSKTLTGLFKISSSETLEVKDNTKALEWAQKYAPSLITVSATGARRVFKGDVATGSMGTAESHGFIYVLQERLVEKKEERDVAVEGIIIEG